MLSFTDSVRSYLLQYNYLPCRFETRTKEGRERVQQPLSAARGSRPGSRPRTQRRSGHIVDFVDGTLYQASSGGSLVAIIADYPGLLPVSHVSNVKLPNGFLRFAAPCDHTPCFHRNDGRDTVQNPRGPLSKRRLDKVGLKGRRLGVIRRRRGMH